MTKTVTSKAMSITISLAALLLSGCSNTSRISNLEAVSTGGSYQAEYRDQGALPNTLITPTSAKLDQSLCRAPNENVAPATSQLNSELLSSGDLVQVSVGTDETYSGNYEVSSDGFLKLRGLHSVRATGRSAADIGDELATVLVSDGMYRVAPMVSVRLTDYGTARAFVTGAVFEPGTVALGGSAISNDDAARQQASGASANGRRLSHALQSAGGIRPDADLSRVVLMRGNSKTVFDLRPAISGGRFNDVILIEGDEIKVSSRGCFQSALVTPSVVSPVGAKVFMSNLTEPANSNANSAIGKDTRELRYGTRMLQAIVSMNCVGGSKLTNAGRSAVLYSRNPVTGKSIMIERNIELLVRNANRDDFDPFILPNDALACYDSGATDIMKLAQSFGIVAGAIATGRGL